MQWIAPSGKDTATDALEKRLWDAADQFRANSGLKSKEYSAPVLGLIFLRFAEVRFIARRAKLEKATESARCGSRLDEPTAYTDVWRFFARCAPEVAEAALQPILDSPQFSCRIKQRVKDIIAFDIG